jgi:hypothetical protein
MQKFVSINLYVASYNCPETAVTGSSKEKVFMIASHKRALLAAALVVLAVGGNQTFAQTRPFYDQIKIGVLTDISGLCAVLAGPGSVEAGVKYTNAVAFADQIDRQSRRGADT